jgi:NitT/TauT family transport system ATP-binding protein
MKISVSSLHHSFSHQKSDPLLALSDINFEVASGEFVAIVGPSGCGKSTLLRILAGLLTATQGMIDIDDKSPAEANALKEIAWMAQNPALLPWHTAYNNVAMAQKINLHNDRSNSLLSPHELLELVNLGDFKGAYPFTLSGGMQQRVVLARTLASGAALWLMDEPFTALDEMTRESLALEVLDLWQRFQTTVLWVTHSIQESVRLADRVLVMSHRPGKIHAQHKIGLSRPRDDTSIQFQEHVRALREALSRG